MQLSLLLCALPLAYALPKGQVNATEPADALTAKCDAELKNCLAQYPVSKDSFSTFIPQENCLTMDGYCRKGFPSYPLPPAGRPALKFSDVKARDVSAADCTSQLEICAANCQATHWYVELDEKYCVYQCNQIAQACNFYVNAEKRAVEARAVPSAAECTSQLKSCANKCWSSNADPMDKEFCVYNCDNDSQACFHNTGLQSRDRKGQEERDIEACLDATAACRNAGTDMDTCLTTQTTCLEKAVHMI